MFSGADHDVDVFASGVVAEDEGDWTAGGQALDKAVEGGASGSAGGAAWGSGVAAWGLGCML